MRIVMAKPDDIHNKCVLKEKVGKVFGNIL